MIKGKNGFWLLTIVFSVIIAIVVMNPENYGQHIVKEMDGTMGTMMKKHHAAGISVPEVLNSNWTLPDSSSSGGHHSLSWFITSANSISISAILLLMPLLLGASVLMIILWI